MIFSLQEFFDVIIMTGAVGYIFMFLFQSNPLARFEKRAFLFSCAVTAPALILHELGHKFAATSFGLTATFNAAYLWLFIGIMLRLMGATFIFFVPAYVSISGAKAIPTIFNVIIAAAGPFLNLALFITAYLLLKKKKMKKETYLFLHVTKQINLFLFIFNMLPIPFFDGYKVWAGLFHILL